MSQTHVLFLPISSILCNNYNQTVSYFLWIFSGWLAMREADGGVVAVTGDARWLAFAGASAAGGHHARLARRGASGELPQ